MTVELINIGEIANDGTGDDLREAFIKVNANFEELDLRTPESTTASNLGSVGEGLFSTKVSNDLRFKRLVQGTNITLTSTANAVTIAAVGGLQNLVISPDSGTITLADGDTFGIKGGTNVTTRVSSGNLYIDTSAISSLAADSTPELTGDLDANQHDILDVNIIQANNVQASIDGLVYGIDIRTLNSILGEFDFGDFSQNVSSIIEWLVYSADVDFGTFSSPNPLTADFGSF